MTIATESMIRDIAMQYYESYGSHGWNHIESVLKNAQEMKGERTQY